MARSVARALRSGVNRLGLDVVRYPVHTTLPGHLKTALRGLAVDVVVDVGANVGQFGRMLRDDVGYKGRIVSFEPDPHSFIELEKLARHDKLWTTHRFACGSEDAEARLLRFEGSDWNSLHEIDQEALARSGRSMAQVGQVNVHVRRLDAMWTEIVAEVGEVVLLKSDTQGHDGEVLDGVGAHFDQVAGLLLEASVRTFYAEETRLPEVLVDAETRGYSPSGFFPVTRTRSSLALDTLDVCFVRKS